MTKKKKDIFLGIDLGTTNSVVSIYKDGKALFGMNPITGSFTTKSSVVFENGQWLVGNDNVNALYPESTIIQGKRFMGQTQDKPELYKNLPFKVYVEKTGDSSCVDCVSYKLSEKKISPEEFSAYILSELKKQAETLVKSFMNIDDETELVFHAVITVPAYFNNNQRNATRQAAEIAGFKVKVLVNEPTAAAIAYGLTGKTNKHIIVFDLGGGTFDISLLSVSNDKEGEVCEVVATNGNASLGGSDFDTEIAKLIIKKYNESQKKNLSLDKLSSKVLDEIRRKAETIKITLTTTNIGKAFISSLDNFFVEITKTEFNRIVRDLLEQKAKEPCLYVLKKFQELTPEEQANTSVICVGGQSRTPEVQEFCKKIFSKEILLINPDLVVAEGAAILASTYDKENEGSNNLILLDVTSLPIGIETMYGRFTTIISEGTTIPTKKSEIFSTAADNQTSVAINILQGFSPLAKENSSLGEFILSDIPAAPRGVPQIEVTMTIDASGILTVNAKEKSSNKETFITIKNSEMKKQDVEDMKKRFEENREKNKKLEELLDLRVKSDSLIYNAENQLNEHKNIPDELRSDINSSIEDLKKKMEGENIEELEDSHKKLSDKLMKIYENIQKKENKEKEGQETSETSSN